jgi:alpha-tubulin suppressor-like RCC1 family protein
MKNVFFTVLYLSLFIISSNIDAEVITWGWDDWGGDSSSVASELSIGVTSISSTDKAFAALKFDGSVVTWGDSNYGGDSSSVTSELSSGVTEIFSSYQAFAALKEDGSVVTWGDSTYWGDLSSVASELSSGVRTIYSTYWAFAALKEDGSVVTWGGINTGGDSSSVASELSSGVTEIFSTESAFAALKDDGSVVTWGYQGGDSSSVASELSSGVTDISSNNRAFAAIKEDGSVVTWGDSNYGGDSNSVASDLSSGVVSITGSRLGSSSGAAFAAIKEDGSVVTWGDSNYGGDSSSVASNLSSGVTEIFSTEQAFAALKVDGSVVTWGWDGYGSPAIKDYWDYALQGRKSVAHQLTSGVTKIFSTGGAFAALKIDGSVVAWGGYGGGSFNDGHRNVFAELSSGVTSITSNGYAFAALKDDGSVITWGSAIFGANSNNVASKLTGDVSVIFSTEGGAFAALKLFDSDGDGLTDSIDPFPNDPLELELLGPSDFQPKDNLGWIEVSYAYYEGQTYMPGIWHPIDENFATWFAFDNTWSYENEYTWVSETQASIGPTGEVGQWYHYKTINPNIYTCKFDWTNGTNGYGFTYDGRIDLDNDGNQDGIQIRSGLTFPAEGSQIDFHQIINSLSENLALFNLPSTFTENDFDGDGRNNSVDLDDDNDGIADSYDPTPLVYNVSKNAPSSLNGYVEIYFSDYYPSYGIWHATGENTSIDIWNDGSSQTRYEDTYSWDSRNLTSTGSHIYDSTFRVNFEDKTNDLFFRFTYVSESNDPSYNDSGKGFFYDGTIDLDKNGMADGEQITNGLTFPATDSIIDLSNILNSAESNLIPIQVLDYAANEKFSLNEVKDLRPGSKMIEVFGNQAIVQLQMEESSDLQTWEDTGTPATMTIPADTDTKFFRFKMAE